MAITASVSLAGSTALATRGKTLPVRVETSVARETFQGKDVRWWAKRAVQARKDANARGYTIKRLRNVVKYSPTIEESIQLATIVYPKFTEHRAWCIIHHESWMTPDPTHARNVQPIGHEHATGLYQFLPSTFERTPFGHMSIYSPFAQSLAAGYLHAHHGASNWQINC